MKNYIVITHVGEYPTRATSERKAISNVRYRLFGRTATSEDCRYWTAKEVAA